MSTTIAFYEQFWAIIQGQAPAPDPAANPPESGDAAEAFAAAADE